MRCKSSALYASKSLHRQYTVCRAMHRRDIVRTGLLLGLPSAAWPSLAQLQQMPELGTCVDCIGEMEGALNACPLGSDSCISVYNDDSQHFVPPWTYDSTREVAVQQLIQTLTRSSGPAITIGRVAPPQGQVLDQHITADGSMYLRVILLPDSDVGGMSSSSSSSSNSSSRDNSLLQAVRDTLSGRAGIASSSSGDVSLTDGLGSMSGFNLIDAEFVFPEGDAIVNVRAASRSTPKLSDASLRLSFESGLVLDRNNARSQMEALRKSLRWEQAPVISEFDPKFNNDKPLWFEPFLTPLRPPQAASSAS